LEKQRLIRLLKTGTPKHDDTIGPLAWTNATPSQPEILDSQLLTGAPVAPLDWKTLLQLARQLDLRWQDLHRVGLRIDHREQHDELTSLINNLGDSNLYEVSFPGRRRRPHPVECRELGPLLPL